MNVTSPVNKTAISRWLLVLGALLLSCCTSSVSHAAANPGTTKAQGIRGLTDEGDNTTHVVVSNFIDEDALLSCRDLMIEADANGDNKLDKGEYAKFVELKSGGRVDGVYRNLGLRFIMYFNHVACTTCYKNTNDDTCCVGSAAHIPLETSNDDRPTAFPTPIQSNAPSASPSESPSSLPSLRPTSPPSSQPSLLPSVSPSLRPSTSPSSPPTGGPTVTPSANPSDLPTNPPSAEPTDQPSLSPSNVPSGLPTMAPSDSPSTHPSGSPSEPPTLVPSEYPSELPSSQPIATPKPTPAPFFPPTSRPSSIPSSRPSDNPTSNPSLLPSLEPTISPSRIPTLSPSERPSAQPSASPTLTPSVTPTSGPSSMPSIPPSSIPSLEPSESPSKVPTANPSQTPTAKPTKAPSLQPSPSPSSAPTETPINLLCLNFAYTLENTGGFTAQEIMDGVNNVIKEGLIIATRDVTISVLNETTTATTDGGRRARHVLEQHIASDALELAVVDMFGDASKVDSIIREYRDAFIDGLTTLGSVDMSKRSGSGRLLRKRRSRRLAFYTDDYPPNIYSIADSRFCSDGVEECVVVSAQVCVVLEESDDPVVVRSSLIDGFRESIESGEFQRLIPPPFLP